MEWLDSVLGVAGSAASGGVLGLAGSLVGGVFKYFQRRQEIAYSKAEWDNEFRLLNLERNMANDENEHEVEIASMQADLQHEQLSYKGLDASIRAERSLKGNSGWVDDLRALFRLFLTSALCAMTMYIFWSLINMDEKLTKLFSQSEIVDLIKYIVHTVVFTTATAVTWWFGDRAISPKK